MVTLLDTISPDELNVLYDMLNLITIPMKNSTARGDFGRHRSATFGISRGRFNGIIGLSQPSKKFPHIYQEILRIKKLIPNAEIYDSIALNYNVTCPRHLDSKNIGESILISFGNYIGGNIVIDELIYDAYCRPIKFNGAKLIHYNTNDLVGDKYSLVFYKQGEKGVTF